MIPAAKHPTKTSVTGRIPIEQLSSPLLRFGLQQWRTLSGHRRFPSRDQIRPREIVHLLAATSLLKVVDDEDFEYCVAGDAIVRAFNVHLQNRRVSEICREVGGGWGPLMRSILVDVVRNRTPVAVRGTIGRDSPGTKFTHHENVVLPLGPEDDTVDHILIFSNYERRLN